MSSAPRFIPHYTIEDYSQWKGDWELIDGVAIAMGPSPFGPHERVVSAISFEITRQLKSNKCRCEVYTNLDWIISNDTVVRPDEMVVCGDQPERHLESAPCVAVEVLSNSTRQNDLSAKRDLYLESGVKSYLIIDPNDQSVQLITANESLNILAQQQIPLQLECCACEFKFDIEKLFS